jgi:hypothetical protein
VLRPTVGARSAGACPPRLRRSNGSSSSSRGRCRTSSRITRPRSASSCSDGAGAPARRARTSSPPSPATGQGGTRATRCSPACCRGGTSSGSGRTTRRRRRSGSRSCCPGSSRSRGRGSRSCGRPSAGSRSRSTGRSTCGRPRRSDPSAAWANRLIGVICDEAAWWAWLEAWRKEIRPVLMDNKGWAIISSTTNGGPDGEVNELGDKISPSGFNRRCIEVMLGEAGFTAADGWYHSHRTARENPKIDPIEFAATCREYPPDSISLAQEMEAKLVAGGAGLAFPEWNDNVHVVRMEPPPGSVWFGGMDWGYSPDPCVFYSIASFGDRPPALPARATLAGDDAVHGRPRARPQSACGGPGTSGSRRIPRCTARRRASRSPSRCRRGSRRR